MGFEEKVAIRPRFQTTICFKAKTRLKVLYQSVRVFLYLPYRRNGNKEIVGSVDDVGHNDGNSKQ